MAVTALIDYGSGNLASAAKALARVADGKSFESKRVRVGDDSAISVWVAGLPLRTELADVRIRLNGTDLPAIWLAPADSDAPRQVNALLPAGMEQASAQVGLVYGERETAAVEIELCEPGGQIGNLPHQAQ